MTQLFTDETQIMILAEMHGTFDHITKDLGYKVYVHLGVADDNITHVMLDMETNEVSTFVRPSVL